MLAPGTLLRDKYRLDREIGRGGMGSVWHATRVDLGTELAVKVMHADASKNGAAALGRFEREAKAAASLSSPHVVRVIDFGVDAATGLAFLAMELLVGESLAERLKRSGRLTAAQAASVITQVARALNQAHGLGIVHRDLKPANVFLVQNEDEILVKLLDFGIAKAVVGLDEGLLTETGNVLGTPHYMSPEQLSSSNKVDPRADLWSLAVIACECLTGQRPYRAESLAELAMRIALGRCETPSSVAPVPVGFDEWFARATQVDPAQRFQTASALAAALTALVAASPGHAALPKASAFDPTWSAGSAAALHAPSEQRADASSAGAAAPTVASLSTTNMGSVLSASPGRAQARRHRWRARRAWLAAGVALASVAGVASLSAGLWSSASRQEPTLSHHLPDPAPPPSTPPAAASAAPVQEPVIRPNGPVKAAEPGKTVKASVPPPARRKRSNTASASPRRRADTRSTPKDRLDAYDWQ